MVFGAVTFFTLYADDVAFLCRCRLRTPVHTTVTLNRRIDLKNTFVLYDHRPSLDLEQTIELLMLSASLKTLLVYT